METIREFAAVALVLALALFAAWWLRRRGLAGGVGSFSLPGKARHRRIETLERLVLGPQYSLHLVRLGGSALLIGTSPGGCALLHSTALCELDKPALESTRGAQ